MKAIFLPTLLSAATALYAEAKPYPHFFNTDYPVVLVEETMFHHEGFYNGKGEDGMGLVVGKVRAGVNTDIKPGTVVLLSIQDSEEYVKPLCAPRRLFITQVNRGVVQPINKDGSALYIFGWDFTTFSADRALAIPDAEIIPEWKEMKQTVYDILNPAPPTAAELCNLPAPNSAEQQLFAACALLSYQKHKHSLPLHMLAPEVADLIDAGADVNARCNAKGMTPLMQAALHNDAPACTLLLQAGADPNRRDIHGMTALNYALMSTQAPRTHRTALEALVYEKTRADIPCTPPQGEAYAGSTALHHAVLLHDYDSLRFLLYHGADTSVKDASGRTPLDLAKQLKADKKIIDALTAPQRRK